MCILIISALVFCNSIVKELSAFELECQDRSSATGLPLCLEYLYKKEVPPFVNDAPVDVSIVVRFDEIIEVNDVSCTVTFNVYLVISWLEPRFKILYNASTWNSRGTDHMWTNLNVHLLDHIWKPDHDIANVKKFEIRKVFERLGGLKLYEDKRLVYDVNVQITLNCPHFKFDNYPFDTQFCEFSIGSYQWDRRSLLYNGSMDYKHGHQGPLQYYINSVKSLSFEESLKGYKGYYYSPNGHLVRFTDVYSHYTVRMEFSRILQPHLISTYLPSFLIVLSSWLGFLVGTESIPGRVTVTIVLLLVIINMR